MAGGNRCHARLDFVFLHGEGLEVLLLFGARRLEIALTLGHGLQPLLEQLGNTSLLLSLTLLQLFDVLRFCLPKG